MPNHHCEGLKSVEVACEHALVGAQQKGDAKHEETRSKRKDNTSPVHLHPGPLKVVARHRWPANGHKPNVSAIMI